MTTAKHTAQSTPIPAAAQAKSLHYPIDVMGNIYTWNATHDPRLRIPLSSPWGLVQSATVLDEGIVQVHTEGHGGIYLSRERQANVPAPLRSRDGWYEEDVEWAIPATVFPESFSTRTWEYALDTVTSWHAKEVIELPEWADRVYARHDQWRSNLMGFLNQNHDKDLVVDHLKWNIGETKMAAIRQAAIDDGLDLTTARQLEPVAVRQGKNLHDDQAPLRGYVVPMGLLWQRTKALEKPAGNGWNPPLTVLDAGLLATPGVRAITTDDLQGVEINIRPRSLPGWSFLRDVPAITRPMVCP